MSFHLYHLSEVYSNADGSVQFVELAVGPFNGESFWRGLALTVTQGATTHRFTFPTNLPSSATANTSVLVATQGFADLGVVTPDFIVPAGFLFTTGAATVDFAGVSTLNYFDLPLDGVHSLAPGGLSSFNSPTNFAGASGSISRPVPNDIVGTPGSDHLVGSAGADRIDGLAGFDLLDGAGGSDQLIGGVGIDTAVFHGPRTSFEVGPHASTVSGTSGVSTLSGIERLRFDDLSVAFDAGGAVGQTEKLLSAVFGAAFVGNAQYIGIGLNLFDGGMNYAAVAELALHARLGPAPSHAEVVQLLYTNVVGVPPTRDALANFVGLLDSGQFTQVSLTTFAADHPLNLAHIDLAGIADHGLEYVPFAG